MDREVKWTKYLWLSLLSFGAFMLEYFSIFVIESILLHVDIWNYTANSKSVHCIIMAIMWAVVIAGYAPKSSIFAGDSSAFRHSGPFCYSSMGAALSKPRC